MKRSSNLGCPYCRLASGSIVLLLFVALQFVTLVSGVNAPADDGEGYYLAREYECEDVHAILGNYSEQCQFILTTSDCDIDSGYIEYIDSFYCIFYGTLRPIGYILYTIWFLFLLLAIAVSSDRIFIPNLSVISQALHLSESVAGETLLPLGNGAADIFTSIAAAVSLKDGDIGILYGTLLGSGAFTITVVVAAVIFIKPFHTSQRPLLRVIIFYIVAVYGAFYVVWDGVVDIFEASVFLLIYGIYLISVLIAPHINALLIDWARKKRLKKDAAKTAAITAEVRNVETAMATGNNEAEPPAPRIVISGDDAPCSDDYSAVNLDVLVTSATAVTDAMSTNNTTESNQNNQIAIEVTEATPRISECSSSTERQPEINVSSNSENLMQVVSSNGNTETPRRFSHLHPDRIPSETNNNNKSDDLFLKIPPAAIPSKTASLNAAYRKQVLRHHATAHFGTERSSSVVEQHDDDHARRAISASPPHTSTKLLHVHHDAKLSRSARQLIRQFSDRQQKLRAHSGTTASNAVVGEENDVSRPYSSSLSAAATVSTPGLSKLEVFLMHDSSAEDDTSNNYDETDNTSNSADKASKTNINRTPSVSSRLGIDDEPTSTGSGKSTPADKAISLEQSLKNKQLDITEKDVISVDDNIMVKDKPLWKWLLHGLNPIDSEEWAESGCISRTFQVLKAPILFCMFLTTPLLDDEIALMNWNRPLNCIHCLTAPLFLMLVFQEYHIMINGVFPIAGIVAIAGALSGLLVFFTSKNTERPKYHIIFAFLGFFITVMWIYLFANEVVNLIDCFGLALNISQSILGITCLAWGNSVGDFINNIAVANQGYSKMAISACYSGMLFNILLGLGITLMLIVLNNGGPVKVILPDTLLVMFAFLGLILASSLVAIPLVQRFYLRRPYAIYLICLYLICITIAILTETEIISLPKFSI